MRTIRPGRGSPQGGILSPIAWNLVMDTLLSTMKHNAIKPIGYADNILLLLRGKDLKDGNSNERLPEKDRRLEHK